MSRPNLHLAQPAKRPAYSFAQLRKAVALFRGDLAPRAIRRANARKWLAAMDALGDKHLYRGGAVRWGARQRPGSK